MVEHSSMRPPRWMTPNHCPFQHEGEVDNDLGEENTTLFNKIKMTNLTNLTGSEKNLKSKHCLWLKGNLPKIENM